MGQSDSIVINDEQENICVKKSVVGGTRLIVNGKAFPVKDFVEKFFEYKKEIQDLKVENQQLKESIQILTERDESYSYPTEMSAKEMRRSLDMDFSAYDIQKRIAISAEPVLENGRSPEISEIYPKSEELENMLESSFMKNELLAKIDRNQIKQLVQRMKPNMFPVDGYIIKEGEIGDGLYVIEVGLVNVYKGEKLLTTEPLASGTLFGELALLYNCKRTASVKAVTDLKVWFLQRKDFQIIMKTNITNKRDERYRFLRSLNLFENMNSSNLLKIVDTIQEKFFPKDTWIIRENEEGDTFYIIISGEVKIYKIDESDNKNKELRTLRAGDYFGEKALLAENSVRTASVVATTHVECYMIQREIFISLVGSLAEREYDDEEQIKKSNEKMDTVTKSMDLNNVRQNLPLSSKDFEFVATLGKGGFGQVDLVHFKNDESNLYALKTMSKKYIVETRQQQHVLDEKAILLKINNPFIVKLYQTFHDKCCIYLLLEPCLGGEIFSMLHNMGRFDQKFVVFCVACVVEAFEHLHYNSIIYRDLKPENMVMSSNGYIKLVDFGFAKVLKHGEKTWTFCGTPEYVAPEIITSKGHDRSADYWSLGILVYELLTGEPPFKGGNDSLCTYKLILRGIEAVKFSRIVPKSAQDLMRKLCKDSPTERLGYQKNGIKDIKKHKFFDGLTWQTFKEQKYPPLMVPKNITVEILKSSKKTKFSPHPSFEEESSGWDADY